MRTCRAGVFFILAIAVIAALPLFAAAQSVGFQTVRDPRHRFTIGVPTTWQVKTSTGDPAVDAESPMISGTPLPDSVDVIVRDLPSSITPEACVEKALRVMRYLIHDFTTIKKGADQVGGRPAYYHVYIWRTSGGVERISYQVCVTQGPRAFIVIGTTANTPVRVEQDMPLLERIAATLQPVTIRVPTPDQNAGQVGPGGSSVAQIPETSRRSL